MTGSTPDSELYTEDAPRPAPPLGAVADADQNPGGEVWQPANINQTLAGVERLHRYRAEIARIRAAADEVIERYQAWAAEEIAKLQPNVERYERGLELQALARRDADPKAPKTLTLPGVQVSTRSAGGGWKITDMDALAEWIVEHDRHDLYTWKPSLPVSTLKAEFDAEGGSAFDKTGEQVPGVTIEPPAVNVAITYPED